MTIAVWKDPLWWKETRLVMDVICAVLRPAATGADDVEVRGQGFSCARSKDLGQYMLTLVEPTWACCSDGSYCWQMRR
jgi:hypothetical protein